MLNDSAVQDRCSELEEQQGRLEGHIRVTEQHCAATQGSVDVLQQANVHLRQQLETSDAATMKQVRSPERGRILRLRIFPCLLVLSFEQRVYRNAPLIPSGLFMQAVLYETI